MTIHPARTLSTKVVTFVTAFAFMFTWMSLATKFLTFAGVISPGSGHAPFETLSASDFLLFFFFSTIWAPLWEEAVWRYAPLTLARKAGDDTILPIAIFSSWVFGWLHQHGPYSLLLQGVMGLVFCWVYLRNGFWWSVLIHATWNLFVDFYVI